MSDLTVSLKNSVQLKIWQRLIKKYIVQNYLFNNNLEQKKTINIALNMLLVNTLLNIHNILQEAENGINCYKTLKN